MYEDDVTSWNSLSGIYTHTLYFVVPFLTTTQTVYRDLPMPDTEAGPEELAHKVSYNVNSGNVTSPWSAWVNSTPGGV